MRSWRRPRPVDLPGSLVEAVQSRPLAELLYRRGYTTPAEAAVFLTGGIDVDAPGLPDLAEGVDHLVHAILAGERICVYGDYDTDGVTSTALLVDLLASLGARVTWHTPNRFKEGYGMNAGTIQALATEGVQLILTCDCGVRNLEEVRLAGSLGMKVVVTDHHELGPELPAALAVINPKRLPGGHPCRMLPGVGTAYLVARQLLRALDRDPDSADRWLDLVAVGIIADVVPLAGANRELARRGLTRLITSPCPGLQALLTVAGLDGVITEEEIAFQVVPRLNSAGRLADAALGVKLLLAQDPAVAAELAGQLDDLNQERRKLTALVVESAAAEAAEDAAALLLYHPEWHEGVLGIAAGKLAEQYGVPAFLMARKHGSGMLVGSARAPEGLPLHEALAACGDHLTRYGGHAQAAGFSLLEDRLPYFRIAMHEEVRRRARPGAALPDREADLALPLAGVDRRLYDQLRRAAPFGEANPAPVLFCAGVKLLSTRAVGPGEKHRRLVLRDGDQSITGLWWGAGSLQLEPGEYDLFYRLGLNRWNGEEVLQVLVEHLGPGLAPAAAAPPTPGVQPELIDHRGRAPELVLGEFPAALIFAEGDQAKTDRFTLKPAAEMVMLTPPASPRLLDEAVALTGARRLVLAWPAQAPAEEDRFLPALMRLLAQSLESSPWVSVLRLAVATGELEATVWAALAALAESDLLAVDEESGDLVRLRRRADGRGVRESEPLERMRKLIAESRAFRRFLRTAPLSAIERVLH